MANEIQKQGSQLEELQKDHETHQSNLNHTHHQLQEFENKLVTAMNDVKIKDE